MTDTIAKPALAWLLTYAVHSTLLLGFAWVVTRRGGLSVVTRDLIWKLALVGGVLTALAQTQLGVRPIGSFALSTQTTAGATTDARAGAARDRSVDPVADVEAAPPVTTPDADRSSTAATPTRPSSFAAETVAVTAWGALAVLFAAFYLGRRLILVGRLASRRSVTDGPLPAILGDLCLEVGYRQPIRLTSVGTISSPVALGFHEICLPDAALTQLEPDQQRGLLAHELAHLVRRDPMWLYASSLIERIFFFQPLNRLARIELQRNAEYLCDDWAAARTGSGLPLAHCLERVAEWIEASPLGVPVAGMAEQRSLLVTRVARLIDGTHAGSTVSKLTFGIAATVLLATVTAAAPGVQSSEIAIASLPVGAPSAMRHLEQRDPPPSGRSAPQADSAVVTALIERLKDTDAGVRRAAASSLGNLKSRRAVAPLIALLADHNKDVRSAAVEALANIEDPAAIPALARLLNDESPEVREHALDGLSNFSDALTVAQVMPALKDPRASLRAKAAEVLGQIGDRSAVAALTHMLADPAAEVRHETLRALEHLQDRSIAPSILPSLRDDNADVRSAAWSALKELGAVIPEADVLAALKDANGGVRREALGYLKDKPSASLVPVLRKMLDDTDSDVRQETVEALSEVRDAAARAALRDALTSADPKVRRRAAEALGDRP